VRRPTSWAVRRLSGALVVTGSHLGDGWTGIKPSVAPQFVPVDVRELPRSSAPRGGGSVRRDSGAAADHVEALLSSVDLGLLRSAELAVDVTGGAGPAADLLLERLGARSEDGAAKVRLLLDPDGDRVELGDGLGYRAGPEATLPLVALARRPAVVDMGADTSSTIDLVVSAWKGRVHVSPTGELNLVRALVDCSGSLAGEGNGGVVVPDVALARDGLAAGLAVLELVARTATPLNELVSRLPLLAVRRSDVECSGETARIALERLARKVGVELVDPHLGVRARRPSGAWGLVRRSGTEAIVRITAEADTEEEAAELHDELREALAR
jgi:phosphomannomutase